MMVPAVIEGLLAAAGALVGPPLGLQFPSLGVAATRAISLYGESVFLTAKSLKTVGGFRAFT